MKDGIGEGFTRDHQGVANQLFSCYAKVGDARALASVIGEDELSPLDKNIWYSAGSLSIVLWDRISHDNRNIITTLEYWLAASGNASEGGAGPDRHQDSCAVL